jgi:hypothetical protein
VLKQLRFGSLLLEIPSNVLHSVLATPSGGTDTKKRLGMRQRLTLIVCCAAMMAAGLYYAGNVWATASSGDSSTTLYSDTFDDIDGFNQFMPQPGKTWKFSQKPTAPSDPYVQQNTWQPDGTTG